MEPKYRSSWGLVCGHSRTHWLTPLAFATGDQLVLGLHVSEGFTSTALKHSRRTERRGSANLTADFLEDSGELGLRTAVLTGVNGGEGGTHEPRFARKTCVPWVGVPGSLPSLSANNLARCVCGG